MGYCGGTSDDPTYRSIGDHTEAISIDYDPVEIAYSDLLKKFWSAHNCRSAGFGRQYRVAVFSRDEAQRELAEQSRRDRAGELGIAVEAIQTPIVSIERFTIAEAYHQKYRVRAGSPMRSFLERTYPEIKAFADSSVAMRLNAILGSSSAGDWRTVLDELPRYGLPAELERDLHRGR